MNKSNNKKIRSFDELPIVMDVIDLAKALSISRVSAYELIHSDAGPHSKKIGRRIKISRLEFERWLQEQK